MTQAATARPAQDAAPGAARQDRWEGLRTLVRARLLVAVLALPVGVLMRPDAEQNAHAVLWASLLAVGLLSTAWGIGVRLRRALNVQIYAQLSGDLALVTLLSAYTGGRASQFVLFFALVVIAGGVMGRLAGGVYAAVGAGLAFLALPWVTMGLTGRVDRAAAEGFERPLLILAFLAVTGVLAGILGERAGRTRDDLERTARELDRVRVDNDVILRHLTTGVLTLNGEGRVAYLNPAAEQMLSIRSLEARGRLAAEALPERLQPLRDCLADALRRQQPRTRLELMLKRPTGRALPVGVSTNPLVHDGAVHGVVAVFQDLTEVREMERRARRNQTLAELGALAAGIAHELRNGLNPITGSVECLQRELRLEGENAVLMELIQRESQRLNRFVTDRLNYSKERDLAPQSLDVGSQLAELRDVILRDPRCTPGTRVELEAGDADLRVRADGEMLRQVWLNLAANALEAMPQGGTLTLRWRETDAGQVQVEFADTGTGVAAEDLPNVGQPFFTTKKGGTGLGLAIAQRIVERHGGTFAFESASARGTVVRVTLPGATADMSLQAA